MSEWWWTRSETMQRFCVIFGYMGMFSLICVTAAINHEWFGPANYLFILLCSGALATVLIIKSIDTHCLDPYKNVEIRVSTLLGNMPSEYSHYTSIRSINNNIKDLFDCYEKDYWVRLALGDFLDTTYIIDGDIHTVTPIRFEYWPLSDIMLAYDDYLRKSEKGDGLYEYGSSMDMHVRQMFEECIAAYFSPLPAGLRAVYINQLHHYDVPDDVMEAIIWRS